MVPVTVSPVFSPKSLICDCDTYISLVTSNICVPFDRYPYPRLLKNILKFYDYEKSYFLLYDQLSNIINATDLIRMCIFHWYKIWRSQTNDLVNKYEACDVYKYLQKHNCKRYAPDYHLLDGVIKYLFEVQGNAMSGI